MDYDRAGCRTRDRGVPEPLTDYAPPGFRWEPLRPPTHYSGSDPNPITGWHYEVVYNTTTGAISSFAGSTAVGKQSPGQGRPCLLLSMTSYSNQTLMHSMYCYAEQGHSGAFPFHVDLTTKEVVWD